MFDEQTGMMTDEVWGWSHLVSGGFVEYVDTEEEETTLIAMTMKDLALQREAVSWVLFWRLFVQPCVLPGLLLCAWMCAPGCATQSVSCFSVSSASLTTNTLSPTHCHQHHTQPNNHSNSAPTAWPTRTVRSTLP